jgi:hypothetical protein
MVRATLVITTPLPSLENSSNRGAAQPKKTLKTSTFVLAMHRLSTDVDTFSTVPCLAKGATCTGRAAGHWHGVGNHQAVIRGDRSGGLDSDGTGDKTGEDDGEDGRMDKKFHDLVTFGGLIYRFVVEAWFRPVYSSRPFELRLFGDIRGYLPLPLPQYPIRTT